MLHYEYPPRSCFLLHLERKTTASNCSFIWVCHHLAPYDGLNKFKPVTQVSKLGLALVHAFNCICIWVSPLCTDQNGIQGDNFYQPVIWWSLQYHSRGITIPRNIKAKTGVALFYFFSTWRDNRCASHRTWYTSAGQRNKVVVLLLTSLISDQIIACKLLGLSSCKEWNLNVLFASAEVCNSCMFFIYLHKSSFNK